MIEYLLYKNRALYFVECFCMKFEIRVCATLVHLTLQKCDLCCVHILLCFREVPEGEGTFWAINI